VRAGPAKRLRRVQAMQRGYVQRAASGLGGLSKTRLQPSKW
jgi:hypothetical protein